MKVDKGKRMLGEQKGDAAFEIDLKQEVVFESSVTEYALVSGP